MINQTKLEYSTSGPFYKIVVAYKAAIAGLVIFSPPFQDIRRKLKPVGLGSTIYPALEFPYSEMEELYKSKEFTEGIITELFARMLINTAYESVKDKLSKTNPTHEFFRHLRHAVSHGGKWKFLGKEPRFPAKWRGKEIIKDLEGGSIWSVDLRPGDILILLNDIESDLQ